MTKVRIHVLAKEMGISSVELMEKLKADGHEVATASSSVDEDVAARYRGRTAAAPAMPPQRPKAEKPKPPGKKPGPPTAAAPVLPPPPPIEKRAKAVKPTRKPTELSDQQAAAAEQRRIERQLRFRGQLPPLTAEEQAAEAEAAAAAGEEPEPMEAPAQPAAVAEAEAELTTEATAPAAAATTSAAPGPSAEPPPPPSREPLSLPQLVEPALSTPAPEPRRGVSLPHVVEHLPLAARADEPARHSVPWPPPEPARPPQTPTRGIRDFRGPIRKIELPPQPSRSTYARAGGAPPTMPGAPARPGVMPPGQTRSYPTRPGTGLGKRKGRVSAPAPAPAPAPVKKGEGRTIRLTEGVTVKELADKMDVKAKDIIRILITRGKMVTVNVALDPEMASSLAREFGFEPEVVSFEEDLQAQEEEQALVTEELEGEEVPRPPVVTVMGHVDHGKTSLLDAIRKTDVAAGEAGGITQSIGAYQVEVNGRKVTFIDTPGHEAFTSMRSRGAQVTDIVVLVVAATEGVMPQTIEAINHAKAAGVPCLVAINKVDMPNARPDRVRTELMSHGLLVETFGGDVVAVDVSAKTRQGIEEMLEMLLLQADIAELKANPARRAIGTVVEAGIDRGKGAVANVIVQDGTLRPGDAFIVGAEYGRVRALMDANGNRLEDAGPATPVQVTGLNGVPKAGDRFQVVENEARAKEISEFRQHKRREAEIAKSGARGSLQDLSRAIAQGETKELPVVIKADVHGAVEVLTKTIEDLSTEKVRTKIIHSGTGAITDSDVLLASASKAIIVGFNVRPERSAAELAEREKVIIRLHAVIYELTDELRKTMMGLLDVVREEEFLGRAEVRETYKISRIGTVAGCYVQEGKIVRNADARLVRDGTVVWTGKLASLRRFKEDAREVSAGLECGIGLEGFNDVKLGDAIEVFSMKEIRPTSLE